MLRPKWSGRLREDCIGTYQEPPYVRSVDGVVHFSLEAIDNDERVPVFDYAGFYVAPTIEVNPGDQIQIAYHNVLAPRGVYLASGHVDETNLHFHGSHVVAGTAARRCGRHAAPTLFDGV